jgi:hypothetical protein
LKLIHGKDRSRGEGRIGESRRKDEHILKIPSVFFVEMPDEETKLRAERKRLITVLLCPIFCTRL